MITLGIFIASLIGYGMVTYVDHGWQYIQVLYEAILYCNMMLCLYGAMLHSSQLINRIHTAVCIS
jgi:hypothetical protein